ncbi:MAG: DUF493 domain-containing protein [Deltaproteobacteria bacterium]|nr:MAG: DUF493 domain-containing protein [Deltaproteobacteria bacterium]
MDRETAIELLLQHHEFPGSFVFRVIVEPHALETVSDALTEVMGGAPTKRTEAWSRTRKYCSIRLTYTAQSPEDVLAGFARLGDIDGVRAQL